METQALVDPELRSEDGSRVSIRSGPEGEILETRDRRGRLVFEYDPSSGRAVVHCAGDLRLHSQGTVEIEGERGIRIETPSFEVRADEARLTWGKLEEVVGRLFRFARDAYVRVESLLHTRAGRIRTEAERSHLLQAENVNVQAREDVRVQGRSINLG